MEECPIELLNAAKFLETGNVSQANELLIGYSPNSTLGVIIKQILLYPQQYTDHLYIEHKYKESKQINIFDLLLKKVPCVSETTNMAMEIMVDFYKKKEGSFTHINVGIGKGWFEKQMLIEIAKSGKKFKRITIIGIDIDLHSLEESEIHINEAKSYFPETDIKFIPIQQYAESLSGYFWKNIIGFTKENVGAISSFSLHHIQKTEDRYKVIKGMTLCNTDLLVLVEPDSNHNSDLLTVRLKNCWNIFKSIFEMADLYQITKEEERLIKNIFFGREIENILSLDPLLRYERHDVSKNWIKLIEKTKFLPLDIKKYSHVNTCEFMNVDSSEKGLLTTSYKEIPLVSVMAYIKNPTQEF